MAPNPETGGLPRARGTLARFGQCTATSYVVAPRSRDVRPVAVLSATGDVTNTDGLLGHGVTALTAIPPPTPPPGPSARTVSDAVNQYLWDPSAGAYLDSDTGPVGHSQDREC
jgi:hypothetical protein